MSVIVAQESPRPEGGTPKKGKKTTTTHPVPIGDPDPSAMRRWLRAHINYENHAGNKEIAERALGFARTVVRNYEMRTVEVLDMWRSIDWMLKGNSLSSRFPGSDIHVAELYKMVEAIVPRLEEALLKYDPWFRVKGRDADDRFRGKSIQYWLEYLLDLARFTDKVSPTLRCLTVYGFFVLKTWWDVRYEERITRKSEKVGTSIRPAWKITATREEKLVYDGLRMSLVDPLNWIVDLSNANHQEGLFCGDRSMVGEEELQDMADMGLYLNVEDVLKEEPGKRSVSPTSMFGRRSTMGMVEDWPGFGRAPGEPKRYERVELWARWKPSDSERAREWIITMVNGSTIVRCQENFHDDKHRGYAVGRVSSDNMEWMPVSPLAHAVRSAIELDEYENLAMRSAQMHQTPITWIGASDTPESLWEVEPGQVIRTMQPPTFLVPPDTTAGFLAIKADLRRDIEEITGAPRIWEGGSDGSGTATEIERKVQEANRRLLSLARAATSGYEQILEHAFALSQQFVLDTRQFRVVGRASRRINPNQMIGPQELGDPVDFMFEGVTKLHTQGLRGTLITTWVNAVAPFLRAMRGSLNVPALASDLFEAIVGDRLGDNILTVPQPLDDMIPADEENMILLSGQRLDVHEQDDDQDHTRQHAELLEMRGLPPEVMAAIVMHITEHGAAAERKKLKARAQGQAPDHFQMQQGEVMDERPVGGKGLNGRTPDLYGETAQGTPGGETPGPPNTERMAKSDRRPAVSQTGNRGR